MKSKTIHYLIVAIGLAALVWANLSNPIVRATDREASFDGQTVPTRTPIGQNPTPKPTSKPPKEPTDTPLPQPTVVAATHTLTPRATIAATATPIATAALATVAPLATETATPLPTSAPLTANASTAESNSGDASAGSLASPTPEVDSNGNSLPSNAMIGAGVVLVILVGALIIWRSRSGDQDKPQ